MNFTTDLPKVAGAYWWRKSEDHKVEHLLKVSHFCDKLLVYSGNARGELLANYVGLWCGPLVAPDEVAALWEQIADRDREYAKLQAKLSRLREEVGRAWREAALYWSDTPNDVCFGRWETSRAKRIADGTL